MRNLKKSARGDRNDVCFVYHMCSDALLRTEKISATHTCIFELCLPVPISAFSLVDSSSAALFCFHILIFLFSVPSQNFWFVFLDTYKFFSIVFSFFLLN